MGPLHFVLSTHQFWKGVAAGLVAAAAVVAGASLSGRRNLPAAGGAFALAAYVALAQSGAVAQVHRVPAPLLAGIALAVVLGELALRVDPNPATIGVVVVPAGLVTAGALIGVPVWVRVTIAASGAIGGACVGDFDTRHARLGVAPVMWLITVGAMYSTVPDTEAARALLGVAIATALLGWPMLYARLGTGGAVACVCMLGWTIGQSGAARPGSVVGGVGTLGVFLLEPIVSRLRDRLAPAPAPGAATTAPEPATLARIVIVHAVCALAAARWAGLAHNASTALLRLGVIAPFALALTWVFVAEPSTPLRPSREP